MKYLLKRYSSHILLVLVVEFIYCFPKLTKNLLIIDNIFHWHTLNSFELLLQWILQSLILLILVFIEMMLIPKDAPIPVWNSKLIHHLNKLLPLNDYKELKGSLIETTIFGLFLSPIFWGAITIDLILNLVFKKHLQRWFPKAI